MAVTNYYSVGGRIIGESTNGVQLDYLTDALGSVTAMVDQTGTVQNSYRYKPYGALLEKTGTAPDPRFTWIGALGYRQTSLEHSGLYIRARHYDALTGKWLTTDPIGYLDGLNIFSYSHNNPTLSTDRSGLACCCCKAGHMSVKITNPWIYGRPELPGLELLGSQINIDVPLTYQSTPGPASTDCTLAWYEKSKVIDGKYTPGYSGPPQNKWINNYNPSFPTTKPWANHAHPCPGSIDVQMVDNPHGGIKPGYVDWSGTRVLCIHIVVANSCDSGTSVWNGYQTLNLQTGQVTMKVGSEPNGYCNDAPSK